ALPPSPPRKHFGKLRSKRLCWSEATTTRGESHPTPRIPSTNGPRRTGSESVTPWGKETRLVHASLEVGRREGLGAATAQARWRSIRTGRPS
ncbi:hypothetical protein GW17_00060184, partial [Ensete ventricosum]